MRQLLSIVAISTWAWFATQAQSLSIATWVVELPELTSTNRAAEHAPFLERAAVALKSVNADLVIVHGIQSRSGVKQLTDLLAPRVYHNPMHSTFLREGSATKLLDPALAVLSKRPSAYTKSIEWRSTGRLEVPGGFSFGIFPMETNVVLIYTAQFPKVRPGMSPETAAGIPRRRELCARYLVAHQNWLFDSATNAGKIAYLATDLEFDSAGGRSDPAVAVLLANGFKAGAGSRTLVAATALSSTGWPPEGSITTTFVKGGRFVGEPQAIEHKGFFAPVSVTTLDLRSTVPKPAPAVAAAKPAGPPPARATAGPTNVPTLASAPAAPTAPRSTANTAPKEKEKEKEKDQPTKPAAGSTFDVRTFSMGAGAMTILVLGLLLVVRGRSPRAEPPIVPAGSLGSGQGRPVSSTAARVVSVEGARVRAPFQVLEHPGSIEADADEGEGLEDIPRAGRRSREPQGGMGEAPGKGSNWPFFQLWRERLVRWLAAERSQLLSSHHAGAEQVLELEERLTRIQNQFENRLRARDQRVVELEAELLAKEKMMADLEQALAGNLQRKPGSGGPPPSTSS